MRIQGKPKDDPEAVADADLSLRSTSRMFSRTLARMVLQPGERIRRLDWGETQLTARQRRLDRALHVEVAPGVCRLLHIEWTMRLSERVRERTAEYHWLSALAARRDARRQRKRGKRALRLSVESVVVVLTGRKKPWPKFGKYQTSPTGKPFTGVKFRIEAVYQQSVAELESKGSLFWLAFVPIAKDADEEMLRRTVDKVRAAGSEDEFVEIVATMMSMAQLKTDRPEFLDVIRSCTKKEAAVRHIWFVEGRQEGLEEGLEEGRQKGLEKGLEEGRQKGLEKGLEPLIYLFERRLGRSLRDIERRRITSRLAKEGPEKLGAAVLDLSPEELAAWLAPRKTHHRRAA